MAGIRAIATFGILATAALLGAIGPALAQQDYPEFPPGPGRDTALSVCSGCHDLNRLTAGYTPEGWLTVTTMMRNFGAPVPDGEWDTLRGLSDPRVSGKAEAGRCADPRSGRCSHHELAAADARLAAA